MEQASSFNRYYVKIIKIWERPTVKRFSAVGATLFLIAFFILVALKPTIETILTLNKKIQDARETETQMTNKINNINSAINTYQQHQADIVLLDEYLPDSPSAEKIIDIINAGLQKSSINKSNYTLSSFPLIGTNGKITITIGASNEYPNILNMLSNLYASKRLITLDTLSIFKSKDESTLDFSITGNSYYEKE